MVGENASLPMEQCAWPWNSMTDVVVVVAWFPANYTTHDNVTYIVTQVCGNTCVFIMIHFLKLTKNKNRCKEIHHFFLDFHYHVQYNLDITIQNAFIHFHKPHHGSLFAKGVSMSKLCLFLTYRGLWLYMHYRTPLLIYQHPQFNYKYKQFTYKFSHIIDLSPCTQGSAWTTFGKSWLWLTYRTYRQIISMKICWLGIFGTSQNYMYWEAINLFANRYYLFNINFAELSILMPCIDTLYVFLFKENTGRR